MLTGRFYCTFFAAENVFSGFSGKILLINSHYRQARKQVVQLRKLCPGEPKIRQSFTNADFHGASMRALHGIKAQYIYNIYGSSPN